MLELKNIVKIYNTGELTQHALDGVSVSFRRNEFVSILGQSGSGKTTMLNIIGGLDRYTSGDLIIDGRSTKEYKDADWDSYRNGSIGFVFQSYNLIAHQSVLANVEMALTIAGVSRTERRTAAINVLKKVGLGDHIHKKPSQLSGGQMQRVAIARALINDPEILLADEPTGALDSETSVQIMELLSEIAKDKLVIMVTHNPELAERYSTRIVRLKDGKIIDDTNPCTTLEPSEKTRDGKKRVSMSFATALSLSFNNLRTKKGRTVLTSLAGSIGIIGIALILALSTGMNAYIENIQKETMASYPITISSQTVDMSSVMGVRGEVVGEIKGDGKDDVKLDKIYADTLEIKTSQMITSSIVENDLTEFKKYLDDKNSEIHAYLGENGVVYSYDVAFSVYSYDKDGRFVNSGEEIDQKSSPVGGAGILGSLTGGSSNSGAPDFSELTAGADGTGISALVTDGYELLYGSWPKSYDEVVLVLDKNNSIGALELCRLGLISKSEYDEIVSDIKNGNDDVSISFSYEDACAHSLYLVCACDHYVEGENGLFTAVGGSVTDEQYLMEKAVKLKISGVIRQGDDSSVSISTAVGYTSALTDYIIGHTDESAVVKAQEASPEISVISGMRFSSVDDASKAADAKNYLSSLGISEKASFYKLMAYYSSKEQSGAVPSDEASMAAALDAWLAGDPDESVLVKIYDEYIAGGSYEDNMTAFGKVSYDAPSSISIYTDSFENKDAIAECISRYNEGVDEDKRITYTDYIAMLTSSLTTVIDGISYVLVAFVSISLIVSCIMIGIITHISVMERTREIGILRALGASKKNVSQVFNAETFIIGCFSGALGVGISLLAIIPINAVIKSLTGIADLRAILPIKYSAALIVLSIAVTIIGGLLPAKKSAKKDPVAALRTE